MHTPSATILGNPIQLGTGGRPFRSARAEAKSAAKPRDATAATGSAATNPNDTSARRGGDFQPPPCPSPTIGRATRCRRRRARSRPPQRRGRAAPTRGAPARSSRTRGIPRIGRRSRRRSKATIRAARGKVGTPIRARSRSRPTPRSPPPRPRIRRSAPATGRSPPSAAGARATPTNLPRIAAPSARAANPNPSSAPRCATASARSESGEGSPIGTRGRTRGSGRSASRSRHPTKTPRWRRFGRCERVWWRRGSQRSGDRHGVARHVRIVIFVGFSRGAGPRGVPSSGAPAAGGREAAPRRTSCRLALRRPCGIAPASRTVAPRDPCGTPIC